MTTRPKAVAPLTALSLALVLGLRRQRRWRGRQVLLAELHADEPRLRPQPGDRLLENVQTLDQKLGFALYGELTQADKRKTAQQVGEAAQGLSAIAQKLSIG